MERATIDLVVKALQEWPNILIMRQLGMSLILLFYLNSQNRREIMFGVSQKVKLKYQRYPRY
jgi:hypothetical protein